MFGPVVNTDATSDLDFTAVEGINIRRWLKDIGVNEKNIM